MRACACDHRLCGVWEWPELWGVAISWQVAAAAATLEGGRLLLASAPLFWLREVAVGAVVNGLLRLLTGVAFTNFL